MTILGLLEENDDKMYNTRIISKLEDLGILKQRDETRKEFTDTAKHSKLKALLDPMQNEWNYVDVITKGRRNEVSITFQGKNALKIFGLSE